MNATEAAQMAREHFYGVPGMLPDLGFESGNISNIIDVWIVGCSVFSILTSKMVEYRVLISNNKVQFIERVD